MTPADWLRMLEHRFGAFPDQYIVIDLETSGFTRDKDLVVQIGFCEVRDGRPQRVESAVLDWTRYSGVNRAWLLDRLDYARLSCARRGVRFPWTWERVAQGVRPILALAHFGEH